MTSRTSFAWAESRRRRRLAAAGVVGFFGELLHQGEEAGGLAGEEAHVDQELDHAFGDVFGFSGANDGASRELAANEWARLRHDQVGLKVLGRESGGERAS